MARATCDFERRDDDGDFCGLPAVGTYTRANGKEQNLCADHWDVVTRVAELCKRLRKEYAK